MSETRLFVGNIPQDVTENDLKTEFGYYGVVKKVELKVKDDNKFGFVNIETNENLVDQCINEFGSLKFRGNFLNVSRAKESFLERLKREREESEGKKQPKPSEPKRIIEDVSLYVPTKTSLPKLETTHEEESSSSSEEEEQEEEQKPIIRIPPKKVTNGFQKSNDYYEYKSDDTKRKEGLKKIKNMYEEKQKLIQAALTSIDSAPRNNKIVFEAPEVPIESTRKSKQLFDDEEEDYEEEQNFEIKEKYSGQHGEKLFELQSRFQNDSRFVVDERFIDEGPKKKISKRELEQQEKERKRMRKQMENWDRDGQQELENEKEKQLEILSSITGTVSAPRNNQIASTHKSMLRFDPSKKEHLKFLELPRNLHAENDDEQEEDEEVKEDKTYEVSEEKFFEVSSNLKEVIHQKTDNKPFSIFDMLGIKHQDELEQEHTKYEEKQIATKKSKFDLNPVKFKYDSSDTDEDVENSKAKKKTKTGKDQKLKGGKFSKAGVWRQNFFVADGDERLKGE